MIVVFVFDATGARVRDVVWQEEDDLVVAKTWMDDGTVREHALPEDTLGDAVDSLGVYAHTYPVEVDDIRSAFKYLGKSADLVETLPHVELPHGP